MRSPALSKVNKSIPCDIFFEILGLHVLSESICGEIGSMFMVIFTHACTPFSSFFSVFLLLLSRKLYIINLLLVTNR